MNLTLHFEGWFQCRMATDPDPTDEPRGVSGTAFALVTEPNFDRVIRFQNPVAARVPGPDVGVRVTSVDLDGTSQVEHPLVGAQVSLVGPAQFIEQNGAVVAANTAFIDPLHFLIATASGISMSRAALWDLADPSLTYFGRSRVILQARQVKKLEINVDEVKSASGVGDPRAFVAERVRQLDALLATETDEDIRAGLQQRLDALARKDWQTERLYLLLAGRASYDVDLNGPAVVDGGYSLADPPDTESVWRAAFWMGAWDNDALCGYVKGTLLIPTGLQS
jgi:hypothetical protein